MTTLQLHLPESIHRKVLEAAARDSVSLDQFVASALAEKLSALMTEEYLKQRASRGNRAAFEAALSSVPDVEPQTGDCCGDRDRADNDRKRVGDKENLI